MSRSSKILLAISTTATLMIFLGVVYPFSHRDDSPAKARNDQVLSALANWRPDKIVDLSHDFYPGIPHSDSVGDEIIEPLFSHEPGVGKIGSGAKLDRYTLPGQWGTHVDAPVHFHQGMRSIDGIATADMILPLVVIDVHEQVIHNPDYQVTMDDVHHWEQRHGEIPMGAFIALRTDWSKRWPDASAFFNTDADGVSHYPGWSEAVLRYLDMERDARGIGHETSDTDPGIVASQFEFPLESWHLQQDRFQIELLTNLDRVPESGAIIIATWPKAREGSGFPARVLALVP